MPRLLSALLALLLFAPALQAQTTDELRRVILVNGDVYVGVVVDEDADPVVIRTTDGIEQRVPRAQVELIAPLIDGRFFRLDPTRTRLVASPTGRTLGRGRTRVGTLFYIVPQATVGVTDRVDVSGTLGLTAGNDFFQLAPILGVKVGLVQTESFSAAVGTNVATVIGEGGGGGNFALTPFAAVTLGDELRAVSASVTGLIGASLEAGDVEAADGVLIGLGGEIQVNNGLKLLLDSFIPVAEGDSFVLVAPGVRLFGDQFSVDVFGGVGIADGGFGAFAPIANFAYTF